MLSTVKQLSAPLRPVIFVYDHEGKSTKNSSNYGVYGRNWPYSRSGLLDSECL